MVTFQFFYSKRFRVRFRVKFHFFYSKRFRVRVNG